MSRRRQRSRDYVSPNHWTRRLKRRLQIGWLIICVATLAVWWYGVGFVDGAGQRIEQGPFLDAAMAILAFPAGLVWVWLVPYLEPLAQSASRAGGVSPHLWQNYGAAMLTWCGATLIGYIQWFWLLPAVFARQSSD